MFEHLDALVLAQARLEIDRTVGQTDAVLFVSDRTIDDRRRPGLWEYRKTIGCPLFWELT